MHFTDDETLDDLVRVHGGITYDSGIDVDSPLIPLTALPSPDVLKTLRCIGFNTLHCDGTRDNWPIERVKEETLSLMQQIEELIKKKTTAMQGHAPV